MSLDTLDDYRCRVCLNITEHAIYLQERFSASAVEPLSYMDVLMLCCDIKISLDDGKPKKICYACIDHARTSYEFKICCERSNLILENEIYITSRYNSIGDIRHEDDAFSDDCSTNDIKDLTLPSISKGEIELIDSDESSSSDEVEPPNCIVTDNLKLEISEHNEQKQNDEKNCHDNQTVSTQAYHKQMKKSDTPENRKKENTNFQACVHKCSTCGRKFNNFRTFSAHIRVNHTEVGKCSYCDIILEDYKSFIVHTKEHHPEKYYEIISCDICGAVFTFHYRLRMHREQQHKILYECKDCDFKSRYSKGFQDHMRDEHGVIQIVDGNNFSRGTQKCKYCNYTTIGAVKLGRHMEMEHQDKKKTVSCDKCSKTFFTRHQLWKHCNNEHNKRNAICDICGMQFTFAYNLKHHMPIHTGERAFKCKQCPKTFIQSSTLRCHMKFSHSEERNVKCDVCGKGFKTKNCLRAHYRRNHDLERNHKCPVCDKAFFDQSELNHHSVVHTGLRLFKCEVCNKGFGRVHHLRTHMRTHTGEKPHMCHVCGKGFSQAHCLRTHLLKHTNKDTKTIEETNDCGQHSRSPMP